MASREEVVQFLSLFHQKATVFGLVFRDDRGKNMLTLLELEITPDYRRKIVFHLEWSDYIDGPIEDTLNRKSPLWVFGKSIKGHEVYIKISMGVENLSAICISFHIVEYELKYQFK